MKRKEEPAESLLTREPTLKTTIQQEGFLSVLYVPDADLYPGKVMVLVGGSDGYFSLTKLIAEQYVSRGLTVLALGYWAAEGLPTSLSHIPLEYAEKAAVWLQKKGYEKVVMAGISMGAEYALLCGSYLPDLISGVIAISPICICSQGLQKKNAWHKKMKLLPGAAFCFREKDLPFAPLVFSKKRILCDSIRRKEICLRSCYDTAITCEKAQIPAEKIRGPVLLLSAKEDSMWPAAESAEILYQRRESLGLATECSSFAYASHLLLPYKLKSRKMFRLERKFPDLCWNSNLDAFQKTLAFLRKEF